jgi:HEPN domain-containing protein
MPHSRPGPGDSSEWIRRARSNLERARADARLPGVYLEDLCFDAQQAAEKAIKAVFVERGLAFPYVHDLVALLTRLQQADVSIPDDVKEAGRLTRFGVEARYPGIGEPVSREEYERAVEIADTVVAWAANLVGAGD